MLPALSGCLLYTHEINGEPSLVIEAATLEPNRGDSLNVVARVSDDEDRADDLTVTWVLLEGACPKDEVAAPANQDGAVTGPTFPLKITTFGPVCLFAQVTDRSGAAGPWQHKQFKGKNRAPGKVELAVSPKPDGEGVIPLYSRVVLTPLGDRDADGDLLKFSWQIATPQGPIGEAQLKCPAGLPAHARCFVPRKNGAYMVQVVAEEMLPAGIAAASSEATTLALVADKDRPPCLELADPAVYQNLVLIPSGSRRTFSVSSVRDDGEPYPGPGENGQTRFAWSIAGPGTLPGPDGLERFSSPAPSFEVSEFLFRNPRPGDQFKVRVEVWDDASDDVPTLGLPCTPAEPVCKDRSPRDGSDCVRWTTWTVQFHP
jgi:hypothetical protein